MAGKQCKTLLCKMHDKAGGAEASREGVRALGSDVRRPPAPMATLASEGSGGSGWRSRQTSGRGRGQGPAASSAFSIGGGKMSSPELRGIGDSAEMLVAEMLLGAPGSVSPTPHVGWPCLAGGDCTALSTGQSGGWS